MKNWDLSDENKLKFDGKNKNVAGSSKIPYFFKQIFLN